MTLELPGLPQDLPVTQPRWVGQPMKRVEDPMLLSGRAGMIDDVELPGMLHCAILRSPYAHARVVSVDVSEAEKLPGVLAVIAGEDAKRWSNPNASGYCLATDKVRFVGMPVAAVAATSRYVAEDAIERIRVQYEALPAVIDAVKAMAPGSPPVYETKDSNIIYQRTFHWGNVDEAFRQADHVFTETFRWNRVGGNPIETFGVISQWDALEESLTCHGTFQMPIPVVQGAAFALGLPTHKVRAIGHHHGGSFGSKGGARSIEITALLSRKTGRPVKYIEDRIEYLQSDGQAWDRRYELSLSVKNDGTATGLRVKLLEDEGASAEAATGAMQDMKPLACFTGCYSIPVAEYELTVVCTNKAPQTAYRGFGPPPHNCVLEQIMDIAARGIGMDPAEFRRKNFIPRDQFPYVIPSGNEYDSGDYEALLDSALKMADYAKLRQAQEEARKQGRYLGIGVVSTIEPGVFNWNVYSLAVPALQTNITPEGARVAIDPFGKIIAKVGFPHQGQGQYTFVTQILADYFSVDPGDIRVVYQDTGSAPVHTLGPGGSRQAVTLAGAVLGAAGKLKVKLSKVAAKLMETRPDDVELMDGKFRVKGASAGEMSLTEVIGTMVSRADLLPEDVDPNPEETFIYTAPDRSMPDEEGRMKSYLTAASACHIALVEVDPETGMAKVLKYWLADDCGTRLNPATVEGIIQGGLAQGLGAALLEEYVYNEEGQMLSSTYMDYLLPTIHEVPMTEKAAIVTPSPFSPLGAKGTGEGAINTSPAAILSAINDALTPLGVLARETPATPNRLWNLVRQAKRE